MTPRPEGLPPIESWWPHLSVTARHELLAGPDRPIGPRVAAEIGELTGRSASAEATLSPHEQGYVATQQEIVD